MQVKKNDHVNLIKSRLKTVQLGNEQFSFLFVNYSTSHHVNNNF